MLLVLAFDSQVKKMTVIDTTVKNKQACQLFNSQSTLADKQVAAGM